MQKLVNKKFNHEIISALDNLWNILVILVLVQKSWIMHKLVVVDKIFYFQYLFFNFIQACVILCLWKPRYRYNIFKNIFLSHHLTSS
jgi:hypothetical protein